MQSSPILSYWRKLDYFRVVSQKISICKKGPWTFFSETPCTCKYEQSVLFFHISLFSIANLLIFYHNEQYVVELFCMPISTQKHVFL